MPNLIQKANLLKDLKNKIFEAEILELSHLGSGICKIDIDDSGNENFVVFVKDSLPFEIVTLKIISVKKNYAYGKVLNFIKKSEARVSTPICPAFFKCGGCSLLHMTYEEQLKFKNIDYYGNDTHYRNKVSFPVTQNGIGYYKTGTHDNINYYDCKIADESFFPIIQKIEGLNIAPYDEKNHSGVLRHIFLRKVDEQIMLCLVLNSKNGLSSSKLKDALLGLNLPVSSIILNYNNKKTNVILGKDYDVIYGTNYITSSVLGYKFGISLHSFYQVNDFMSSMLYEHVLMHIEKDKEVLDLYCGVGIMAIIIANSSKKVRGVEIVEEAVLDAIKNAKLNNITNASFELEDARNIQIKEQIIILDPPRKGVDEKLLIKINESLAEKIIYVSCNEKTLKRDIEILTTANFEVTYEKRYDFFPNTLHIETLAVLKRRI